MKKLLESLDKFAEKRIKPIDERTERLRKLKKSKQKQLEEILRRNGYDDHLKIIYSGKEKRGNNFVGRVGKFENISKRSGALPLLYRRIAFSAF